MLQGEDWVVGAFWARGGSGPSQAGRGPVPTRPASLGPSGLAAQAVRTVSRLVSGGDARRVNVAKSFSALSFTSIPPRFFLYWADTTEVT